MYELNYEQGIVNEGNLERIKEAMEKAKKGGEICLSFLGGSITQGAVSSESQFCYASRVYEWWKTNFPKAKFVYNNAGIGGTTSQFGVARVEGDVLVKAPDLVIVEFSVNDMANEHFMETYEGLIRRIYMSKTKPAILIVHSVQYDDGKSAEEYHKKIGKYYDIPCISMKSTIYKEVVNEKIRISEITPDNLHPNDTGHFLVADVITYFLQKVKDQKHKNLKQSFEAEKKAITRNRYEKSVCYQAFNSNPVMDGFQVDPIPRENIADCFRGGWVAKEMGARIEFQFKGKGVAIQYRKTKDKPAPIAKLVLDGLYENPIIMDANFDEEWGDLLELTTIAEDLEDTIHKIEIEIIEVHDNDQKEFYLRSVIII